MPHEAVAYVLDDHNEEGQLDGERLLGVKGARDVVRAHVGTHNFEDRRLNVGVGNALDVAITHIFVPNLERLGAKSNWLVTRTA